MRSILFLAAMALVATPLTAATPCRDSHGKFIKCPPKPTVAPKATQCRDAKGKFIKCASAPAAKPKQCRDSKGKFIKCK